MTEPWNHPEASAVLEGLSAVFTSLKRALICLDHDFCVVHASAGLDDLVGANVRQAIIGQGVEDVLGTRLFGEEGILRQALVAGELREGWGATLRLDGESLRDVSITTTPLKLHGEVCDPRVAYLVVVRPLEVEAETNKAPTVYCGLIARAASMMRIFSLIEHLRESDATVLVTGESGTGKELVARALHQRSPRANGPFVAVNCGAIPGELLESELFGHVRGAFTGAVRNRVGRFELAKDGTIFLDEVGDLPLHLQVKLLRVLQEHTFERVGESESRKTNARVLAATHLDLRQAIVENRFRDDLYYRLRVVPIEVPPLRQRREDIEPLAEHLIERITKRSGRSLRLAPDVMPALLRYAWPGNVRELENALEFAVAVCRQQVIQVRDLPPEIANPESGLSPKPLPTGLTDIGQIVRRRAHHEDLAGDVDSEKERLARALEEHQWRRDATARALGMSRTTLWRKMREHGLLEA